MKVLIAILSFSLLAATGSAQGCARITGSDLGSIDAPSRTGLIARRRNLERDTPLQVQLFRYNVVCEAASVMRDMYRHVSVVAEYGFGPDTEVAQFEFSCGDGDVWGIDVSGSSEGTFTTPPSANLTTSQRSDCYSCLSPLRTSSSNINHCVGCTIFCNRFGGLRQCTGPVTCCNFYNRDGTCVRRCPTGTSPRADFTCDCPPGFTGSTCDTAIDFCRPNPCNNSGTCQSSSSGFNCSCPANFTGNTCEIRIDPCRANPCINGGTCIAESLTSFSCMCPPGLTGSRCQDDIDECQRMQCLNGGICQNTFGSYMCQCGRNWEGQLCETCGIENCNDCVGFNAMCTQCDQGYNINAQSTCSPVPTCDPMCVNNGRCVGGTCVCQGSFVGNDCSDTCSSRIPNCIRCRMESNFTVCEICGGGHTLINNQCRPPCTVDACSLCALSGTECQICNTNYNLDPETRRCVRLISDNLQLTYLQIIGISVGATLAFTLIMAMVLCCLAFTCKTLYGRHTAVKEPRKKVQSNFHTEFADTQRVIVNDTAMDAEMDSPTTNY